MTIVTQFPAELQQTAEEAAEVAAYDAQAADQADYANFFEQLALEQQVEEWEAEEAGSFVMAGAIDHAITRNWPAWQ